MAFFNATLSLRSRDHGVLQQDIVSGSREVKLYGNAEQWLTVGPFAALVAALVACGDLQK
jgi:hypothetical protein